MREIVRDDASAPFFEGTAQRELRVPRCDACGHHVRPAALACTACHGSDLHWVAVSGAATLVTWTVVHAPDGDAVAGVVELAEGPWLDAPIVGADPATLEVGTPLGVEFVQAGDEHVPAFGPRREG